MSCNIALLPAFADNPKIILAFGSYQNFPPKNPEKYSTLKVPSHLRRKTIVSCVGSGVAGMPPR